ncbi:BTB/POZ domain-containing protein 1-like [Littorina saxatilis]|uniref:BTB domain-containing protein n=1 Tax=Littorina saxatilis TaxID=31220 RepID=A0AAN9C4K6_9CAEN
MDGDRQENPHPARGTKDNPAKNKAGMTRNMGNTHANARANQRDQHHQHSQRQQQQERQQQQQQGRGGESGAAAGEKASQSSAAKAASLTESRSTGSLPSESPQHNPSSSPQSSKRDSVTSTRSLPVVASNMSSCTLSSAPARAPKTMSSLPQVTIRADNAPGKSASKPGGNNACTGVSANAAKSANSGVASGGSVEEMVDTAESPGGVVSGRDSLLVDNLLAGLAGGDNPAVGSGKPPQNAANAAPFNWQSQKISVKERLAFLYNTDTMADVQFLIGREPNTQLVPAHKFVLSMSSAVFDALFNGGMATSESVIQIPDVEPSAFLALLKFVYTDEVQIGPETVMTTLYCAKKYDVPALERACVEFLKRNLSSDNAFMLLTQARLFDEQQLAALCLETIDKNTTEALVADGFTDIDINTLCAVLERDTLGIRECKLFTAVCRWAEAECIRRSLPATPDSQKEVLQGALRLIRFPLMTVEEFAMGAAQSGLLEDREVVELFLYFTVNPKPPISFLDVPRCCLTGKEQVVSRFCQIESRWGYSGTSDRIRFMVNRRIFVVGFGLYGSIHGPTEYTVNIQILHMDTGKVMGCNDTSFQCDGSTSTFRVMFKEPVEVLPNTNYIACSTLKGPDSYYGSKGLRKVTHESVSSGKVTFQFTYAAGNNNGTSVEDGQIPEIIFYT